MNDREVAEAFHLAFLQALQTSAGHDRFALKGGGALRFFYASVRYSEDIDLDVFLEDTRRFSAKVTRAMESTAMLRLLSTMGIEILSKTARDQSTAKERWTVTLAHRSLETPTRTKVELAYRSAELLSAVVVEPVPTRVMANYAPLLPPVIGRYLPYAAMGQKIHALKERGEGNKGNQPRDVFDLDLLFRGWPADAVRGIVPTQIARLAAERAMEMTWPQYRSTVVSFLEPAVKQAYDSPAVWAQIQERVIDKLRELSS